jgi:hypothetical protein
MVHEPPAGTSATWWAAALVPVPAGFTASTLPWTTASPMPSLTHGTTLGCPPIRSVFVSFSVTSQSAGPSARSV